MHSHLLETNRDGALVESAGEEDSSVMMTVIVLISILHVFVCIFSINKRL